MIQWNYDSKDYKDATFKPVPVGDHRVRIEEAEETTSKAGNPMIKMTLKASGHNGKLFYYMVFDPANRQMTNKKLGDIYESFQIPEGTMELLYWIGKVGAAHIKHEDYEGKPTARIAWFLTRRKQDGLPPWQEADNGTCKTFGESLRDDPEFAKAVGEDGDPDIPF